MKDWWSKLLYSHSLGIASAWDYAVDGPLEGKKYDHNSSSLKMGFKIVTSPLEETR